jgi:hypothetical protein
VRHHIEQVPALAGLGDPFGYGHALTDVATNYRPFGPLRFARKVESIAKSGNQKLTSISSGQ